MRFDRSALRALALLVGAAGCLDSVDPPARTPQATVAVPSRLFLASPSTRGFCEGLFAVTTTAPGTLGQLRPVGAGFPQPSGPDIPHNCYVDIDPAAAPAALLPVDVHEVTNAQYQFCVDSGACNDPDPSEVTKTDVCRSEDEFDDCPVVGVSYPQAANYCAWVGRRLPTGLDHALIRQAGLATTTSTNFPLSVPLLPTGDQLPESCTEAVLGNADCERPFPVVRDEGLGSAPGDTLTIREGKGSGALYDLVGNVAEILQDLAPDLRSTAQDLPWFCVADLPERIENPNMPFPGDVPPRCPAGASCVFGRYKPGPNLEVGEYPVCITVSRGATAGSRPVLVGASYFEELLASGEGNGNETLSARNAAGVFGRRVLTTEEPDEFGLTRVGRRTGFRCVGQRISGDGDRPPSEFDDRVRVRVSTGS